MIMSIFLILLMMLLIKKKDLVDYVENMKGKVVADKQIQNSFSEIENLSENVKSLVSTNERLTSELMVVKNVNNISENRIVNLEICKDSDINVSHMDNEGCHILPLGRNTTNTSKRVIVKFVNRKHSEAMLQRKKDTNTKNKVFVTHSLCLYYGYVWGKCKDLQRKGRISQVFCLGAA